MLLENGFSDHQYDFYKCGSRSDNILFLYTCNFHQRWASLNEYFKLQQKDFVFLTRGEQIFQKSRSQFQILDAASSPGEVGPGIFTPLLAKKKIS